MVCGAVWMEFCELVHTYVYGNHFFGIFVAAFKDNHPIYHFIRRRPEVADRVVISINIS